LKKSGSIEGLHGAPLEKLTRQRFPL